ncbi:hypothetical protein HJG43_05045 [Kineosporiaceae bacterium SCSIO 59966]|nr:hypothetical protein HJG43_05045 [Kineosporiaceae bacterium SCSIO 59966]
MTARLDELVHRWGSAGFSGRAWAPEEEVVIEAPRYADSLILTAERSVLEVLMREGLEVHPVSRARDIPIWCD